MSYQIEKTKQGYSAVRHGGPHGWGYLSPALPLRMAWGFIPADVDTVDLVDWTGGTPIFSQVSR